MKIKILREDGNYAVISKPAGIAVHEGAGEAQFTVVDFLKENFKNFTKEKWKSSTRPGIIHRLDKDTSGILLVAKNQKALDYYQDLFRKKEIEKHYTAVVCGKLPFEKGRIDALIRRDPKDREKQKVELIDFGFDENNRVTSATEYEVKSVLNYKGNIFELLDVRILTGRKHQIRVHMKFENCPILGDQKYFNKNSKRMSKLFNLERQFLHASRLKYLEYKTNELIEIKDELPEDLEEILDKIS